MVYLPGDIENIIAYHLKKDISMSIVGHLGLYIFKKIYFLFDDSQNTQFCYVLEYKCLSSYF